MAHNEQGQARSDDSASKHAPEDHGAEQGEMSKQSIEGDAEKDAGKLKSSRQTPKD